jgi:hypothetical protein
MADKKRIIRKWRAEEEEERHKGSLIQKGKKTTVPNNIYVCTYIGKHMATAIHYLL